MSTLWRSANQILELVCLQAGNGAPGMRWTAEYTDRQAGCRQALSLLSKMPNLTSLRGKLPVWPPARGPACPSTTYLFNSVPLPLPSCPDAHCLLALTHIHCSGFLNKLLIVQRASKSKVWKSPGSLTLQFRGRPLYFQHRPLITRKESQQTQKRLRIYRE